MESFSLESMVRGYHVYKDIWISSVGEELPCQREPANLHDRHAVAVMKDGTVVGHIPRKISCVSSCYIRRGGSILCRVIGTRRYSEDLPQGGMEIPCSFQGETKHTAKAKMLVESCLVELNSEADQSIPPRKRIKMDRVHTCSSEASSDDEVWIQN